MRTTEVFIEQLLIGLLVLAAAGALLHPPLFDMLARAELGALALLGGAAYITGIAYDRFADTVLADVDRHNRLLFALDEKGRWGERWEKRQVDPRLRPVVEEDPYPENLYRVALLESGEATEYAHYLRTRMRLTRAVATLGPASGAGAAALLLAPGETATTLLAAISATGYGLAFLLGLLASPEAPPAAPGGGWRPWHKLPKTFKVEELETYEGRVGPLAVKRSDRHVLRLLLTGTWSVPLLLGVTLANGFVLWWAGATRPGLFPFAGLLLSLLFGWVWWRISYTFFQFVRDHHLLRHAPAPAPPQSALDVHPA